MANNSNIPESTLQFIHRFITSAAQLEVLLLVAAKQQRDWSVGQVNDELRSGYALMAEVLGSLHQAGLLTVSGSAPDHCYRYAPDDVELGRQVDALMGLYRERRHSVLSAIYERPAQTADPIQAFSDAFRFRSSKGNE